MKKPDMRYDEEPDDQQDAVAGETRGAKSDEGEAQQALIPKALLAGHDVKVGDEFVIKVDEIRDSELVISYASDAKDENESDAAGEGGPPAEAPAMAGGEEGGSGFYE